MDLDYRDESALEDRHPTELRDQQTTEMRTETALREDNESKAKEFNASIKVRTKVKSPSGQRQKQTKRTMIDLI